MGINRSRDDIRAYILRAERDRAALAHALATIEIQRPCGVRVHPLVLADHRPPPR
jgi:hypothetical protein